MRPKKKIHLVNLETSNNSFLSHSKKKKPTNFLDFPYIRKEHINQKNKEIANKCQYRKADFPWQLRQNSYF